MKRLQAKWDGLPLGSKLALLNSLLVVGLVLLLTLVSIDSERATFKNELENQAKLLLDTMPRTMQDSLYRIELDELLDIARVANASENVLLVRIFDSSGFVLVDGQHTMLAFSGEADSEGVRLITLSRTGVLLEWQEDRLLAGRPIYLGNELIGALQIGLSTKSLATKIETLTVQSLVVAGIALVFGIGFAFLFASQITTPLSQLVEVSGEMASGNLSTRVNMTREDEVGRLAKAYNQMAEAIQKRETELMQMTSSLEKTVEERTHELRDNVKELVRANAELTVARKKAEEATQLKSQFLASMSHELRTPLNAIMGFSQLLLAGTSGPMSEKQTEKVERIFKNSQTLLELINDVLDLSKIESGRMEMVHKKIVLADWLTATSSQLEPLAAAKGLAYSHHLDQRLPREVVCDPTRLQQIAMNLISNAVKFTEKGSVSFDVIRHDAETWAMVVSDTGIGIASHMQEIIFDEFRQVDGSSQRRHSGTGLGLAIVRNLAIMMGGRVRVKSALGEGSTFTVYLPLNVIEPVL